MRKIIVGTTNEAKIAQLRGALAPMGVRILGVSDEHTLPEVIEDGNTVTENARKKALIYARALRTTVLSMDNTLYIEGLSDEEQPGLHVRRVDGDGKRLSDEEALEYYRTIISRLGDRVNGHWEYGICVATPKGEVYETVIKSPRVFVATTSKTVLLGYPMLSIQIDPDNGKYISEMTENERAEFWQKTIGRQLGEFVDSLPL